MPTVEATKDEMAMHASPVKPCLGLPSGERNGPNSSKRHIARITEPEYVPR
jgi:hypothetical protein